MPSEFGLIGICFREDATQRPMTDTGAQSCRYRPEAEIISDPMQRSQVQISGLIAQRPVKFAVLAVTPNRQLCRHDRSNFLAVL